MIIDETPWPGPPRVHDRIPLPVKIGHYVIKSSEQAGFEERNLIGSHLCGRNMTTFGPITGFHVIEGKHIDIMYKRRKGIYDSLRFPITEEQQLWENFDDYR